MQIHYNSKLWTPDVSVKYFKEICVTSGNLSRLQDLNSTLIESWQSESLLLSEAKNNPLTQAHAQRDQLPAASWEWHEQGCQTAFQLTTQGQLQKEQVGEGPDPQ